MKARSAVEGDVAKALAAAQKAGEEKVKAARQKAQEELVRGHKAAHMKRNLAREIVC